MRYVTPSPSADTVWIISTDGLNAFASLDSEGNQVITVTLSMVSAIGTDESAWAALFGHEMAHHHRRHADGRASVNAAARNTGHVAANVLGILIPGVGGMVAGTVGGTATSMALYGAYTRPQEEEADALALEWMVAAGYDPRGLLRLLDAISQVAHAPALLSTHPSSEARRAAVQAFIARQ